MTHKIHMGDELTVPYGIGSGFKVNEFGYPGIRSACTMCHVGGSEQLPLKDGLSNVNFPANVLNPLGPESAACLACHDSVDAASHALSQTTAKGESCSVCHGDGRDFSVNKVHAQ
jgi:OmcA/MtrC family decaheme c-type cytochrome